jgi:hypothetical protein
MDPNLFSLDIDGKGHTTFRLRPQLVSALKRLGWRARLRLLCLKPTTAWSKGGWSSGS